MMAWLPNICTPCKYSSSRNQQQRQQQQQHGHYWRQNTPNRMQQLDELQVDQQWFSSLRRPAGSQHQLLASRKCVSSQCMAVTCMWRALLTTPAS
jgi:hypothetical protein